MKSLRRLLLTVALLVAGLLGAAMLLPRLVDADTLRKMLIIAVRNHTGRELTVQGDVRIALLPRPAVVLPGLSLADAPGFGPEPFASLGGARINLRLWPLLRRRLEVASVQLDRPQLRLTVNARGRSNWADLRPAPDPARPGAATAPGDGWASRIGIEQLSLRDADILWADQRSGRWARLRGFDVALGGLDPGRAMPVRASAVLDVGDPLHSAQLDISASLQRGADGVWHAPDVSLAARLDGGAVRKALALRLTADASFDPAQSRLRLQQLALAAKPVQLRGELTLAQSEGAPVLGAQLRVERLDARDLAARFGWPLAMADPAALSSITGSLEVGADQRQINLARIDLAIDGKAWRGTARVTTAAVPGVRFALESERLDLDQYLPVASVPQSAASPPAQGPPADASASAMAGSPAATLRRLAQLDLDGTLNLETVTTRGLTLERVALRATAGHGRLAIEPLSAGMYGGAVDASMQADARSAEPTLRLKLAATDVAAGPMLTALTGNDALQGRFTLGGEVTGAAAAGEALLRSLRGSLSLSGSDGVLRGVNADRSICQARARVGSGRDKGAQGCDPSPDTRFSALRISGPVAAGVWRSDDLLLEQQRYRLGRFYRLSGAGTLDLATGQMDYRLKAAAVHRAGDAADTQIREALVPLRLRGRAGDWHLKPDLGDALRGKALRKLRERFAPAAQEGEQTRQKALAAGRVGALSGLR